MNRINTIRLFASATIFAAGSDSDTAELKPQVMGKAWIAKMNKKFSPILLLTLALAGCSTHEMAEELQRSHPDHPETFSEEEQKNGIEGIRRELTQYQMEARAGMPLPVPLDGSHVPVESIEKEQPHKIFRAKISPETRYLIRSGCIREIEQGYRKLCQPAI